jgi:hypothetical protein
MRRLTEIEEQDPAGMAAQVGLLLRAFWEHQDGVERMADPGYRALTAFLLGIRLMERWGPEVLASDSLSPLGDVTLDESMALMIHLEAISQWAGDDPDFHVLGRLYRSFQGFFNDPAKKERLADVSPAGLFRNASRAVRFAPSLGMGRFLPALLEHCLLEARAAGDWLTLGLVCADNWWSGPGSSGPPIRADVSAIVLTTPYGQTPIERLTMAALLTNLKLEGITNGVFGDLERAVIRGFQAGRNLAQTEPALFRQILGEANADFAATGRNSLGQIADVYVRYIGSADPADWEDGILDAAKRYVPSAVGIPYLPEIAVIPSVLRCAVDFGLWGGLMAVGVG